ncbi:MAG: hypothetical protein IJJ72_08470 [Bacteroidales bacterium]|nr:hypothetical protein [Bacteroidales bacterium]MBR0501013.1 hypothetical protein [Bacteroidales bacterium]
MTPKEVREYLKELIDRLSVCLTYAGEDIEDFIWVLDQDEKDGRAPADVNGLRDIYRKLKEQYEADSDDLKRGLEPLDCLDIAVHLVEMYQSMYDYLMSGDEADYTGEPVGETAGKPRLGPRDADFSAMYELFKKNKDLPS